MQNRQIHLDILITFQKVNGIRICSNTQTQQDWPKQIKLSIQECLLQHPQCLFLQQFYILRFIFTINDTLDIDQKKILQKNFLSDCYHYKNGYYFIQQFKFILQQSLVIILMNLILNIYVVFLLLKILLQLFNLQQFLLQQQLFNFQQLFSLEMTNSQKVIILHYTLRMDKFMQLLINYSKTFQLVYINQTTQKNILILLHILLHIMMWLFTITQWPTFKLTLIQYQFSFIININVSLYISFLLETTFEKGDLKGYGLYHFIWILIMLFYIQLKISQQKLKSCLFFKVNSEQTLLNKIYSFEQIIKKRDQSSNLILVLGIIRSHSNSDCKNNQTKYNLKRCYCKMKLIYDPKKQNDIRNLSSSIIKHMNIFSKFVIKSWYEDYLHDHQNNHFICLQYAQYLFYKINLHAQSLIELYKVNTQLKSLSEKYQFCKLTINIKRKIEIQCSQSYKQKFDFEIVVSIEECINKIQRSIIYIMNLQIKMFKSIIKQNDINEQELIQDFEQMLNKIQEIKINWKDITRRQILMNDKVELRSFLHRKKEFVILYNWFRQNILKKKVKQSQIITGESDDFIQEDSDSNSENDHFYDQQKIFNLLSGILHCNINGEILKFSQNCQNLYGQQQLNSIFELIPHSMQRNHQIAMRQFIENGKRQSLFKKLKIFYINETSHIVQANKYLKCIINQKMQIEYVCMIRPIIKMTPNNFILLNEYWEIDSMTAQLDQLFTKQSCLLIQCPKLLKYSQYQLLMKENDYDFFQLRISQHQTQYIQELTQYIQSQQNTINESHQTRRFFNGRGDNFKYLLDQALVDENINGLGLGKNNMKFHKIIDENNITLHIRLPLDSKQLNDDYQEFKRSLYQNDQITKSMRIQRYRKIIVRNQFGLLRFDKFELLRRIQKYRLLCQKKHYSQIKYCSNTNNLCKVIKIEGSIHFTTKASFDKTIIIKLNRFEFYEQEAKKYTNSSQSDRKKTTSSQSTQFILRRNSDIFFQNFFQNQSINFQTLPQENDYDSIRDNINKTLITENELQIDFSNQKAIQNEGLLKQNWIKNEFIKDDLNKIPKSLQELTYIKLLNRFLLISLVALIITEYIFGPQHYISSIIYNSFNKVELVTTFAQIISQTYSSIIDLDLSLKNIQIVNLTNINQITQQSVQELNQLTLETKDYISIFSENADFNENISILDLMGSFKTNINIFLQALQNINQNNLNETISFCRQNIIPYLQLSLNKSMGSINQEIKVNLEVIKEIFQVFLLFITLFNGTIIFSNIMLLFQMIKKIKLLLSSFQMINKQQFVQIYKYLISLRQQLKYLNISNLNGNNSQRQIENLMQRDNLQEIQDQECSNIKYTESQHWIRLSIKVLIIYVSIISTLLLMGIYYNFYLQSIIGGISYFMQSNAFTQNLLTYWVQVAIKDVYCFNQKYQDEININQYIELISEFQQMQISKQVYNNNLQTVQSLFYGNSCNHSNLNLSSYEMQQCQYSLNGALTKGLIVYYDSLYQISISLTNSSDSRFEKASLKRLLEYSEVQGLVFTIQKLAISEFNQQMSSKISEYISVEKALVTIFIQLTCLLYYLIIEKYFHNLMNFQYKKFRQFYLYNYPNSILHQNKTLRARFKKYGILKK
ncbi:unnamed protein product [Paramecium sonneborni]|uniref:Transmembrane protein n=1 Tax=Paramecium sonneborni TaxID=65129 RepID=A0A8S1PJI7_9CILI|nr:unnamed protein product [Paramecium sonneborni]